MLIQILISVGIASAVSLSLGVLLALCIRFFAVEENEKVKSVRACLPGVNCGACGYKGCNDYAEAVAQGTASPSLCVPGAKATSERLCALLGVEPEAVKDVVALVHCNGTCDAVTRRVEYAGLDSCKARALLYASPEGCLQGCLGCGDCRDVCPNEAICLMNGVARVDSSRCIGCGLCVATCPKRIISLIPKKAAVAVYCSNEQKGADARKACKNACIGCKKCEKLCPNGAIAVINNRAVIDYEKCTGCGTCAEGCPTKCLKHLIPSRPSEQ